MCQGGSQGNFMQEGQTGPMTNVRPGFGGSASWGGNYGNQINSGYGNGWGGNPWNAFGSGSYMGTGGGYGQQGQNGYSQNQNYNNAQNQGMNYNNTQNSSTARGNQQGTSTDPFAGIKAGRLAQAQRFANAGLFGRASQQIGLGGGNWDDVGGLLRQQAAATDNYGGDWNWGKASDADVAQAQRFADAGMMGKARGILWAITGLTVWKVNSGV